MRERVLLRDARRCQLRLPGCTGLATEVDHIVPVVDGGTDELGNLRAACRWCNRSRGPGRRRRPIRWFV